MAVRMIAWLRRLGQERFITKSRHYQIERVKVPECKGLRKSSARCDVRPESAIQSQFAFFHDGCF